MYLSVKFDKNSITSAQNLDLSMCTYNSRDTLKVISIDWTEPPNDSESAEPITTILGALQAVQKHNVLETIQLQCLVDGSGERYIEEWSELAKLLVEHDIMFPRLQKLEVIFVTWVDNMIGDHTKDDVQRVQNIMREPLTIMHKMVQDPRENLKDADRAFKCDVWVEGAPFLWLHEYLSMTEY